MLTFLHCRIFDGQNLFISGALSSHLRPVDSVHFLSFFLSISPLVVHSNFHTHWLPSWRTVWCNLIKVTNTPFVFTCWEETDYCWEETTWHVMHVRNRDIRGEVNLWDFTVASGRFYKELLEAAVTPSKAGCWPCLTSRYLCAAPLPAM